MKWRCFPLAGFAVFLAVFLCAAAHADKKPKITKVKPTPKSSQNAEGASAEPDKVLYDRAVADIQHRKFTEARLNFQTLINTYPDSEYLAKAKLGMADSFYKEGGTSNLTQAIEEYKNFIVFFPFLDEASYAQMQVGMAHFQMMEKSDRDSNQAQQAEAELQTFLLKYPDSALVPKAEQRLREVQEILADGEYRIGRYYYVRLDYRAAAARLMEVSERYPLYSQSDDALAMLGDVYMRARRASKNEDEKNHWADLAGKCYQRIARDYPLSRRAAEAKTHLTDMGMTVPAADPQALARMQHQQMYEKHRHGLVFVGLPMGMLRSRPDVYMAANSGPPNLNPPDDSISATEVLKPGATGPSFDIAAQKLPAATDAGAEDNSAPVEIQPSVSGAPSSIAAAQIIEAPEAGASTAPAATPAPSTTAAVPSPSPVPATTSPAVSAPASDAAAPAGASAAASAAPTPVPPAADSAAANASGTPASTGTSASKSNSKGESTSKKKKGLKKLVPF